MSERYPGGIISQTAPVPSGPYQNSTAPGVWTLEQQAYWARLGQWPTAGNTDPSAFIENLFQTYLYTGTGASQTITNNIDLAGKGGLTWIKSRASGNHFLVDTVRGATKGLFSNSTAAQATYADSLTSFNSNGFSLGADQDGFVCNVNNTNYCSWTFREQAKFFDVVTYTGNGSTPRNISHSLGSTPGMIIIKRTSTSGSSWWTWHRSISIGDLSGNNLLNLNNTNAQTNIGTVIGTANSTTFQVGDDSSVNLNGATYVAYLFAHNAGGFGVTGNENVISCGSYTGTVNDFESVNLGYEPQFLLIKRVNSTGNWFLIDNIRGFFVANTGSGSAQYLYPNLINAETGVDGPRINATGFSFYFGLNETYIYMTIRRGPMKTPTVATTVFNPVYGQSGAPGFRSSNFNAGVDTSFVFLTSGYNDGTNAYQNIQNRLIGLGQLQTGNTRAEISQSYNTWDYMNGQNNTTFYSAPWGSWLFRRAPGFHDVVCYTGTGSVRTVAHNLGAVPELMIHKIRSSGVAADWGVYCATIGAGNTLSLNNTNSSSSSPNNWNSTAPTSSVFTLGTSTSGETNYAGETYVAYLFATVAGVSKVGSYTGTGSTQTINAGLPTGARFVLIKRTDSAGNWWVWDTTRGMVAGTNPRLALNNYNAQINNNWVYTTTNGFEIVTTDASVNANGGSYIYLAIA